MFHSEIRVISKPHIEKFSKTEHSVLETKENCSKDFAVTIPSKNLKGKNKNIYTFILGIIGCVTSYIVLLYRNLFWSQSVSYSLRIFVDGSVYVNNI